MKLYAIGGTIEIPDDVKINDIMSAISQAAQAIDEEVFCELDQVDRID